MEKSNIFLALHCEYGSSEQSQLFSIAESIRRKTCENKVYIRAVIEVSNNCWCSCNFCGNAVASRTKRYRLSYEEIKAQVDWARAIGIDVIHLASGEDNNLDLDMIKKIIMYISSQGMYVELALGKKTENEYIQLFKAGAHRYILKFETSNPLLFSKVKDCHCSLQNIYQHLKILKKIGYQVGSGNIVGLPGQTVDDLVSDLYKIQDLEVDMASTSVFTPNAESTYCNESPGSTNIALNYLALLRIMNKRNISIPTNSTFGIYGKQKSLSIGANEVSLNLTPLRAANCYSIYTGKDRSKATLRETLAYIENANMRRASIREVIYHD